MTHKKPASAKFDAPYLDDEEQDLIEGFEQALDSGAVTPTPEVKMEKVRQEWQEIGQNTTARKAITLRLQQRDIERLKVIARQKGMPYQTLVSSVLHQFASGELRERIQP